jgi:hypothetical protein
MRRLSVILGLFTVIAVPAAALAAPAATGDGSLVVKNGSAPVGTNVVVLQITGSVIGDVGHGRLVIDAGPNAEQTAVPQVTGAEYRGVRPDTTAQIFRGSFKFRAVGGTYTVLVSGDHINLVAVGTGTVKLAGIPDTPSGDGKYSLNGGDFVSLPGTQTEKRSIGSNG